jgi:hypothetical protein
VFLNPNKTELIDMYTVHRVRKKKLKIKKTRKNGEGKYERNDKFAF